MDDHDDQADLSERDLSGIADEDLTEAERAELKRRMDDFVERMQLERYKEPAKEPKPQPKRFMRWDPATIARRH